MSEEIKIDVSIPEQRLILTPYQVKELLIYGFKLSTGNSTMNETNIGDKQ